MPPKVEPIDQFNGPAGRLSLTYSFLRELAAPAVAPESRLSQRRAAIRRAVGMPGRAAL